MIKCSFCFILKNGSKKATNFYIIDHGFHSYNLISCCNPCSKELKLNPDFVEITEDQYLNYQLLK